MNDRAYIISRTLENKIAIAENNDQNTLLVTLDVLKEILAILKEQEAVVRCKDCENSKHWYGDKRRCFLWHESGIDVFDDGFCNYGKHKEGEVE